MQDNNYGIDWESPVAICHDTDEEIIVPTIPCPLNEDKLHLLQQCVDPLQEVEDLGVGLYLSVRDFIYANVQ